MPENEDCLIGDAKVAAYLAVSCSYVRGQRFKRRHGLPHSFEVDPVYIGTMPRYRLSAVKAWADSLKPSSANTRTITPKKAGKSA